jgi:integrase
MRLRKGTGHLYKRGGIYWVQYYRNGKRYRESSYSTKEIDAKRLLKRKLGEIAVGRFIEPQTEKVMLKELTDDLQNDYRVNGKRSINRVEDSIAHLLDYFIDDKAITVTTDRIRSYISHRQEQKAANATINRELAVLKRSFNLGVQAQKVHARPYIPTLEENNIRKGFFEHGDFVAVRDMISQYLKPVVIFLYFSGWRKEEALSLEWRQVDMEARSVRLDPGTTKNKEGRVLFLDGELLQVIEYQWEKRKVAEIPGESPTLICPYVFHRGGKRIGDFRKAWKTACRGAGLEGRIPHDFRRTAIRNMVRAGIPERVVMAISGHKTRSVFDRYNIVSEEDLREAARKASEHIRRQSTTHSVRTMKTRTGN